MSQQQAQERVIFYVLAGIAALLLLVEPRPADWLPVLGSLVVLAAVYTVLGSWLRITPVRAAVLVGFCSVSVGFFGFDWLLEGLPAPSLAFVVSAAAIAWMARRMESPWSRHGSGVGPRHG